MSSRHLYIGFWLGAFLGYLHGHASTSLSRDLRAGLFAFALVGGWLLCDLVWVAGRRVLDHRKARHERTA